MLACGQILNSWREHKKHPQNEVPKTPCYMEDDVIDFIVRDNMLRDLW